MSAAEIDDYLRGLDEPHRSTLEQLRRSILAALPDAQQGLSYGVPAFRRGDRVIAGFSAAARHLSYLPHSGMVLAGLDPARLGEFETSKGALKFPVDTPLPDDLVQLLVDARLAEIDR